VSTRIEHWEEPGDGELAARLPEGYSRLVPLPGTFERIRRRTNRRRRVRQAAMTGLAAALIAIAGMLLRPRG
jgi:hypothetical protein